MVENWIPILVHFYCREFMDTRKSNQFKLPFKELRSSYDNVSNWKEHFLLCAKAVDLKHSETSNVINVRTIPILENIIAVANKRQDKWGGSVLGRLESCTDLVVVEAIYHSQCMTKFRLKRSSRRKRGKTVEVQLCENCKSVCVWLEKEENCDLHTFKESQEKMKEKCNREVYSSFYMKKNVEEQYSDHVYRPTR